MCGIAGYVGYGDTLSILLQLLIELQHRGQEASGIAVVTKDGRLYVVSGKGLVSEVFSYSHIDIPIENVFGGIGHVRYATSGGYMDAVTQPIAIGDRIKIAIAFNGTIANYKLLAKEYRLKVSSDTEFFANAIYIEVMENKGDVVEALKALAEKIIGGYSIVVLTNEPRIIFAKDPRGFRPLSYVYNGDELYIASETSALETVVGGVWREVEPGEIIVFDGASIERTAARKIYDPTPCVFEYVYFSRIDSVFNGVSIYTSRIRMGIELANMDNIEADVVIPVPDSGRAAAIGYSKASGIPIEEGIYANKYLGRGFITPPHIRDYISRLKYGFIRSVVDGKKVVLVDDSIVRGTTMRSIVLRLREADASEVHVRIASPPFRYPCFMGIDVASRQELLAWSSMSLEDIRKSIGANSILYNTVDALTRAVGLCSLCTACFTGRYPFNGYTASDLENMFSR